MTLLMLEGKKRNGMQDWDVVVVERRAAARTAPMKGDELLFLIFVSTFVRGKISSICSLQGVV